MPQPATVLDARPAAADFRASASGIALHGVAIGTPGVFVLSTLSGLGYAAGFPPLSWPIAPWLALTPFLVACAALSPSRAALAGMCWAVTAAIGVAGFLPTMLSGYFGLATLPSWLGTVAIVGILHGVFVRRTAPGSPGSHGAGPRILSCWQEGGSPASWAVPPVAWAARGRSLRTRRCTGRR